MASKKPYNPNTKYGRKKLREQAAERYEQMSPAEKVDHQALYFVVIIIIIAVVGLIFYLAGDMEGFKKWLTR